MANYEIRYGVGIIPEGTEAISVAAFKDSQELTNVVIPNSVKEIEALAFASTNLTSIVIPESVTQIGAWAFQDCKNLTPIILDYKFYKIPYCVSAIIHRIQKTEGLTRNICIS